MKYGYNLTDEKEKEMYFTKKKNQYSRLFDTEKTDDEKAIESIQELKKEREYFLNREQSERELQKQIEKKLPQVIEKTLNQLLNGLK